MTETDYGSAALHRRDCSCADCLGDKAQGYFASLEGEHDSRLHDGKPGCQCVECRRAGRDLPLDVDWEAAEASLFEETVE